MTEINSTPGFNQVINIHIMFYFYFILAAVDFMKANPVLPVDVAAFQKNCGIGVNITPDQIEDCVSKKLKDLIYSFKVAHISFT